MASNTHELTQLVPGLDYIDPGSDGGDPIVATAVVKGAVQVEDLHGGH